MANEKDANVEFSSYEIDAVGEILNISMGSAAPNFSFATSSVRPSALNILA